MPKTKYNTNQERYDAFVDSVRRYQKKAMTAVCLRFHNENDKAVLDKLASVPNKVDYIRQLIIKDLEGK